MRNIIEGIEDALSILEEFPHDMVQHAWNMEIDRKEGCRLAGQEKTKSISKGPYRRSLRKTLQCLKVRMEGLRSNSKRP